MRTRIQLQRNPCTGTKQMRKAKRVITPEELAELDRELKMISDDMLEVSSDVERRLFPTADIRRIADRLDEIAEHWQELDVDVPFVRADEYLAKFLDKNRGAGK